MPNEKVLDFIEGLKIHTKDEEVVPEDRVEYRSMCMVEGCTNFAKIKMTNKANYPPNGEMRDGICTEHLAQQEKLWRGLDEK